MNETVVLVVKILATVFLGLFIFSELFTTSVEDELVGRSRVGEIVSAMFMAFIIFAIWI